MIQEMQVIQVKQVNFIMQVMSGMQVRLEHLWVWGGALTKKVGLFNDNPTLAPNVNRFLDSSFGSLPLLSSLVPKPQKCWLFQPVNEVQYEACIEQVKETTFLWPLWVWSVHFSMQDACLLVSIVFKRILVASSTSLGTQTFPGVLQLETRSCCIWNMR